LKKGNNGIGSWQGVAVRLACVNRNNGPQTPPKTPALRTGLSPSRHKLELVAISVVLSFCNLIPFLSLRDKEAKQADTSEEVSCGIAAHIGPYALEAPARPPALHFDEKD
jgi:hypothetical protein